MAPPQPTVLVAEVVTATEDATRDNLSKAVVLVSTMMIMTLAPMNIQSNHPRIRQEDLELVARIRAVVTTVKGAVRTRKQANHLHQSLSNQGVAKNGQWRSQQKDKQRALPLQGIPTITRAQATEAGVRGIEGGLANLMDARSLMHLMSQSRQNNPLERSSELRKEGHQEANQEEQNVLRMRIVI